MKINFPITITAADTNKRTISGTIVSWNEKGNTSAGATVFAKDSIDFSKPVKLLLEHDKTRPLGKLIDIAANDQGLEGTFKLAKTFAADDALEEAATGLRDGFSVGVMVDAWDNKDGAMVISKSSLAEVSLVSDPAIASARVESVIATETTPENSEATAEEQTKIQEDKVSDTTSEAPIATEAVEAAKVESVTVQANQPVAYTKPRFAPMTSAQYLENSIRAAMGDDNARQLVLAADSTTSTNTGLTLPQHMQEFVTNTISDRPAVDAVSRGVLPSSGLSFTVPRLTTAPTVNEVNEGAAMTNDEMASDYLTASIVKLAAKNEVSWELIDRSSPEFITELLSEMTKAYAKKTDKLVLQTIVADGTVAATSSADADGLQAFLAVEAAAAKKATGYFARNLVASTDVWASIMGMQDSSKRALYTASNPQNNSGNVSGQSLTGTVLGANLYVDANVLASGFIDDSCFLIVPEAITYYESPTTRLQVQLSDNGKISIQLYGYASVLTKQAGGIRRFNKA
jgi:HK97 family phage prohead protease